MTPQPQQQVIVQARAGTGELYVAVQFSTPQGTSVFFLDQRSARQIGVDMQKAGSTGIVLAAATDLPQEPVGP